VLPPIPLRQFVLTLPFELRARVAFDGALLGAVGRLFVDSVLGFYRRRLRETAGLTGQSGAVTVVQRTSADLRPSPSEKRQPCVAELHGAGALAGRAAAPGTWMECG